MHSVDLLNEVLALAVKSGFEIRNDYLGDSTGGACRIGGKWLLFVDQTLPAPEQLTQVVQALRSSRIVQPNSDTSATLRQMLAH